MSESAYQQIDVRIRRLDASYKVVVGSGVLACIPELLGDMADAPSQVAIVCDATIADSFGATVAATLHSAGIHATRCRITADEQHKSIETVSALHAEFLRVGLDRTSLVIAVGGGVTGDTAGFAAATFLRGVRFINVPTTLLSMVDASVGGKTGVNVPLPVSDGTLGKNLIGAYHQPSLVVIDVDTLDTLPDRHLRAGLAECIKHAILADASMLTWIEENAPQWASLDVTERIEFIARNVSTKKAVVEQDERDVGTRMMLNLGHTFAHVLETQPGLDLLHGEAVGLGLIAAAATGESMGRTDSGLADRLRVFLEAIDLPTRLASLPPVADLTNLMRHDKKAVHGQVRLIIPMRPGTVEIVPDVPNERVHAGWRSISGPDA